MLSFMAGGLSSQLSNAYAPLNTEAYNMESGPFMPDMTAGDLAFAPLKLSFQINSMRAMIGASRNLGITSSLKDPYSRKSFNIRRGNAYDARHMRGILGDIIDAVDNYSDPMKTKDSLGRESVRTFVWSKTGRDQYINKKGRTLVDRGLISKSHFERTMNKIDPAILQNYDSLDDAYDDFLGKIVDTNGKYKNKALRKEMMGQVADTHRKRTLGIFELITGRRNGEKISRTEFMFGKTGVAGQGGFGNLTDTTSKRLWFGSRQKKHYNKYGSDVNIAMRQFVIDNSNNKAAILSNTTSGFIDDFTELSVSRLKKARMLKGLAIGVGGAAAAVPLLATAVRAYLTVPTRIASTLDKYGRNDFGSGEVLQNSSIATERQRAMMAIRDAQLNARSLMGNEASFMH